MVRLKGAEYRKKEKAYNGFNSTMVRLKDNEMQAAEIRLQSFNSTMVRLKAVHCAIVRP